MLLMEGVATPATGRRAGARHALMVCKTAPDQDAARAAACDFSARKGWDLVALRRAKAIDRDTATIADDTLLAAAESALASGSALIVYRDEISPDA